MANLKNAGDVDIKQLVIASPSGSSLDVRNQVVSINIFEDMFSPFITGTLVIKDSLDFVNYFPLIGDETLYIEIATPGFNTKNTFIRGNFKIFKLSDREMMGNRSVGYILHFISSEAVIDLNTKISKSYNDTISNTAASILKSFSLTSDIGRYNVETTVNNLSYVSNFWSPTKNLNYLAENAVSITGSPTFLFFENRNGLNFLSMESLFKTKPIREFTYNNYNREMNYQGSDNIRNIEKDFSKIIDILIPTAYDYIERMRSGTFSSTLITHNITTKSYNSNGFDFLSDYDKDVRLNKYPLITPSAMHSTDAAIAIMHKSAATLSGTSDITNSAIFQKRRSLLALSESCKVQITILGRTDYTVGQIVTLNLPRNIPIDKGDTNTKDNMFSGNYIVSSLRHAIDREKHTIRMELIKDSSGVKLKS